MDPDANLKTQLEIVAAIHEIEDAVEGAGPTPRQNREAAILACELAAHVEALDEWMRKGGHLPTAWKR